jgi:hypothetical protein
MHEFLIYNNLPSIYTLHEVIHLDAPHALKFLIKYSNGKLV